MAAYPEKYLQFSDHQLLRLLADDDHIALRVIYDRYVGPLYQAAIRRLPVQHKAEDLVQEIFVSLHKNRKELRKVNDLRAWLFACLRHRILNEIRDFKLHEMHHLQIARGMEGTVKEESVYDLKVLEKTLQRALAQLTERCREVFLLSRVGHLSNKKIASRLDVSVKAVEKQITSALRELGKEVDRLEE